MFTITIQGETAKLAIGELIHAARFYTEHAELSQGAVSTPSIATDDCSITLTDVGKPDQSTGKKSRKTATVAVKTAIVAPEAAIVEEWVTGIPAVIPDSSPAPAEEAPAEEAPAEEAPAEEAPVDIDTVRAYLIPYMRGPQAAAVTALIVEFSTTGKLTGVPVENLLPLFNKAKATLNV